MACFKPLKAFQPAVGGKPYFGEKKKNQSDRSIQFPCGQCSGCRLERSRQWAIRCVHEASLHEENMFLTLTYDNENLPQYGSLSTGKRSHFQLFMKRLRQHVSRTEQGKTIRFFHCGEYGEKMQRPHYHAIIFNHDFPDKALYTQREDVNLYISDTLNNLWGHGFCTIGDVTFDSAAYVARYVMKKINVSKASPEKYLFHYTSVDEFGEMHELAPEYTTMSRRPGIAYEWYKKWKRDVYPSDEITHQGRTLRTPAYYDKLFDAEQPDKLLEVKKCRLEKARKQHANNTPERLATREQFQALKSKLFNSRKLENEN